MFYVQFVLIVQFATAAEDEGEGCGNLKHNPPPVIITGRPKEVPLLRFHFLNVLCCSSLICFHFNIYMCPNYLVTECNCVTICF